VAALDQMLERVEGPVAVVGNAYAGAVIASTSSEKIASLVYIAAENQRFMAERMKARVHTAPADHMPMITAPSAVVDIVLEAVRQIGSRR
jgi:pimeloyl-ACP methyl ester carboxylesterase